MYLCNFKPVIFCFDFELLGWEVVWAGIWDWFQITHGNISIDFFNHYKYTDILRFEQYICGRGAALISPLAASNLKKASHVLLPFSTYFTLLKKIHRGTISGAGLGKIVILISRKDWQGWWSWTFGWLWNYKTLELRKPINPDARTPPKLSEMPLFFNPPCSDEHSLNLYKKPHLKYSSWLRSFHAKARPPELPRGRFPHCIVQIHEKDLTHISCSVLREKHI